MAVGSNELVEFYCTTKTEYQYQVHMDGLSEWWWRQRDCSAAITGTPCATRT